MILGNLCTRGCGFCSVPKSAHPLGLDPDEPANVAKMAAAMRLRYVVITSVNRDDLEDGGSHHFALTVEQVKNALPEARVEVLTPDFCGDLEAVARVLDAGPHVFNHAMGGKRSRDCKTRASAGGLPAIALPAAICEVEWPESLTKSGLMVGLGETADEVEAVLRDLREADVGVATLGQYLQPRRRNLRVEEYVTPEQFDAFRDYGLSIGFKMVFSGPLVRSSYMAEGGPRAGRRVVFSSCPRPRFV